MLTRWKPFLVRRLLGRVISVSELLSKVPFVKVTRLGLNDYIMLEIFHDGITEDLKRFFDV